MSNTLEGRVAVVTGGGGGIGGAVSRWLAAEGCSVVVNDPGAALSGTGASEAPANAVVSQISAGGGRAIPSYDSVATFEGAERIVQAALDAYGRLDIVCHAAGILRDRMVFNMSEEEWNDVLRVHLYGAFNLVRQAVPHMMRQRYGRILLFSSVSALGNLGQANYSAAKAGQIGLARSLAKELAPHNITVNAVLPGADTRMTEGMPETARAYLEQWGRPSDAPVIEDARSAERNAPKIAYLCTEAAASITGQVIGAFGLPMTVYSPRQVVRTLLKSGDWSLDDMELIMPNSLTKDLASDDNE